MMLHAPAMAAALVLVATGGIVGLAGGPGRLPALAGLALVAGLAVERLVAGIRAAARFRDPTGLWFPPVHLVRDAAWAVAIVVWCARRTRGRPPVPADSMLSRE